MSGGYFDYKQYIINDIKDEMEHVLERIDMEPNGTYEDDSLKEYIEDGQAFKEEVEKAINHLKMAHLYTQRIDWFLSGDDGENSFYERLTEELKKSRQLNV